MTKQKRKVRKGRKAARKKSAAKKKGAKAILKRGRPSDRLSAKRSKPPRRMVSGRANILAANQAQVDAAKIQAGLNISARKKKPETYQEYIARIREERIEAEEGRRLHYHADTLKRVREHAKRIRSFEKRIGKH